MGQKYVKWAQDRLKWVNTDQNRGWNGPKRVRNGKFCLNMSFEGFWIDITKTFQNFFKNIKFFLKNDHFEVFSAKMISQKYFFWIRNFQLSKQKIIKFPKITSKTNFLVFLLYLATYFTPTFFIIVNIIAIHDVLKVQTLFYISLLLSKKNNFKICKRRLILPHWLF